MKNTNPNRVLSQTAGGNCEKVSRCEHDKCVTVAMLLMYLITEHNFLMAGANFVTCLACSSQKYSLLFTILSTIGLRPYLGNVVIWPARNNF